MRHRLHKILHDNEKLSGIVLLTVCSFLAVRLLLFVQNFAVNLLYWDQFDFLNPFFDSSSLIERFLQQHGPHRQGLGALWLSVLYPLTRWDTKTEALFTAVFMIVATCFFLMTCRRLNSQYKRSWSLWHVAVPSLCLSLFNYEIFVGAQNPSHGALPLLLLSISSLILGRSTVPLISVAAFASLSMFTGFGILIACSVSAYLFLVWASDFYKSIKNNQGWYRSAQNPQLLFAVALLATGWSLFFQGYRNMPAVDCFKFPNDQPLEYILFMSAGFSGGIGLPVSVTTPTFDIKMILGFILLLLTFNALFQTTRKIFLASENSAAARVVFLLSSTSLGFFALAAIGRACLGWWTASSSRYLCYSFPGIISCFIFYAQCLGVKSRRVETALTLAAMLLLFKETRFERKSLADAQELKNGKLSWLHCFKEHEDIKLCDSVTGFSVFPIPQATNLKKKLEHLKLHHLNLYKEND